MLLGAFGWIISLCFSTMNLIQSTLIMVPSFSLDFGSGPALAVVTVEVPLQPPPKEGLHFFFTWVATVAGTSQEQTIVYMFLYELTSSYFFSFNLRCFVSHFTQMLSFRQFSGLQHSTFSCGACGQTLDSVLIKVCPCKLLLPQNARVNLSSAIAHFTSSKGS